MKNIGSKYHLASLLAGVVIFLFWWLGFPQALNYQEQNQLFLFSSDYFYNSLHIAGGLADYISEFIVQFYYVPWFAYSGDTRSLIPVISVHLVSILLYRWQS